MQVWRRRSLWCAQGDEQCVQGKVFMKYKYNKTRKLGIKCTGVCLVSKEWLQCQNDTEMRNFKKIYFLGKSRRLLWREVRCASAEKSSEGGLDCWPWTTDLGIQTSKVIRSLYFYWKKTNSLRFKWLDVGELSLTNQLCFWRLHL